MNLSKYFIGIDLSGPVNTADTALVVFQEHRSSLILHHKESGVDDALIFSLISNLPHPSQKVVGLDAPLSYQPGGGDRVGDDELRKILMAAGLPPGTVMTPTMTRMAYLTLRGMAVARALQSLPDPAPDILEVHPGGVLCLHGAPLEAVLDLKRSRSAQKRILEWLESQGMKGGSSLDPTSDHLIAACAAAFAAWRWSHNQAAWSFPANPPLHPYPIIC